MNVDLLRASLAALCVVAAVVLMVAKVVTAEVGMPIITLVVGWAIGTQSESIVRKGP